MKIVEVPILMAVVASLVCIAVLSDAQQPEKVYRIGYLRVGSRSGPDPVNCRLDVEERDCAPNPSHTAFRERLRELGYVLGQNYVIEYRNAQGNRKRLPALAAELVQLEVDVIVTSPAPPAIRAAQEVTRTIPIIMAGVTLDPVTAGFVKSLARPGGNITGLAERQFEVNGKRLEILKDAFPQTSRVVLLVPRPPEAVSKATLTMWENPVATTKQGLGIEIRTVVARPRDRVDAVFTQISEERPDALLVPGISFTERRMAQIIAFTATRRLPTIYARTRFADAGGLMSYGVNDVDLFRNTATYVDKVLKGSKPADLPVERPSSFEFVINLKTAKQLDLTIPPSVLFKADRVIR